MRELLSNVHTHTSFCDGDNTPEQMAGTAYEMGFHTLGFSGHAPLPTPENEFWIDSDDLKLYAQEIIRLKEQYKSKMEILLGLEMDYYSSPIISPQIYDFIICSCHYIKRNGVMLSVDKDAETMEKNVKKWYGGNYKEYINDYYEMAADVVAKTALPNKPSIVGHFDLVGKFNKGSKLYFDEDSDWYKKIAKTALEKVFASGAVFEVNTGAMYRGGSDKIYPSPFLLGEINRLGGSVMLASDSHSAGSLGYLFDEAVKRIKNAGFSYVKQLTLQGFVDVKI